MHLSQWDLGRKLAMALKFGLALMIASIILLSSAMLTGVAPQFDQQIALDERHILLIHYGARDACASIPNPPQHDCFRPGPEQRVFSVDYRTPYEIRSLVWFRLPMRYQ